MSGLAQAVRKEAPSENAMRHVHMPRDDAVDICVLARAWVARANYSHRLTECYNQMLCPITQGITNMDICKLARKWECEERASGSRANSMRFSTIGARLRNSRTHGTMIALSPTILFFDAMEKRIRALWILKTSVEYIYPFARVNLILRASIARIYPFARASFK